MKTILIINGHPDKESFCHSIAEQYEAGASLTGATVNTLNLIAEEFSPVLKYGYRKRTELEPFLQQAQKLIKEADHLVFVYPTWWGGPPALLKGFLDRVFLPGFAFKYRPNSVWWDKLLTQKSARIITTMDTPAWYYKLLYGNAGVKMIKNNTLNFCGISPVKTTYLAVIKDSSADQRNKWLKEIYTLGRNLK
ncbi:NADPH:quinone reductase [Solitalea longa]|uniref:NADPH:quinone reductase n=1 Tax=Solitalea longa TaxID=2079460 RepID=A0A2S5A4F3_9SPHI|nr:NAD(P)H-dependent oxidoreductase [Solitalea longa]POY37192.1 NADPH:quinone reductase [Solitalea longa]